ncbi:MAG: carboxypeptidase regulatory-like domain-containing protein, partial [Bacteroides sp.]|nr:carboxypeptidase regulatory-like domain-containing protein [Bacteroides sp.]
MKKTFFFLLTLLLACGFAWADGVSVSGKVTVTARGTQTTPNMGDSVLLRNESITKVAKLVADEATGSYGYEFSDVAAGKYALVYNGFVYGLYVAAIDTITVENADIVHDIAAVADPSRVDLTIIPQILVNQYGGMYPSTLQGISVNCKIKGEAGEGTTVVSDYSGAKFAYLDTAYTYAITLQKEGYKDSVFDTKAFEIQGSDVVGKTINVLMQEDLGNQVTLKGTVSVDGYNGVPKLPELYLALMWGDKTYTTKIENGAYEFGDKIPVGEVTYYLTASTYEPTRNLSKNWVFKGDSKDTNVMEYTLEGADNATVTNNLTLKRIKVELTGKVVDTMTNPGRTQGINNASVKLGEITATTNYNGEYTFNGLTDGTYTIEYSSAGYAGFSQEVTINMSQMALDSTVTLPNVSLKPQEGEYVFSGNLSYYDASYASVPLQNAKVICYEDYTCNTKLDSTYSDENGNWSLKVTSFANKTFYFRAFHEDIEVADYPSSGNTYQEQVPVTISCTAKTPDLLGMENARAEQIGIEAKVRLSWEWPEELKEGYKDQNGNGTYMISRITVYRRLENGSGAEQIGIVAPDPYYALPPTEYIDSATALEIGQGYVYHFEIMYGSPSYKSIEVTDPDNLTVTLRDRLPDSNTVTLVAEPAKWGTVAGAGKYVEDRMVKVTATPNENCEFKGWLDKNGDTVNKGMEFSFRLVCDTVLTAVFDTVIPTATVSLSLNKANWGTIAGAGEFPVGSAVTVNALPKKNCTFKGWVSAEDTVSREKDFTFTLVSDTTLTAIFDTVISGDDPVVVPDSVTLTLNVNDAAFGEVLGAGKYEKGEEVTVKATANTGYKFVAWVSGNDTVARTAEFKLTLNSDSTLTAV